MKPQIVVAAFIQHPKYLYLLDKYILKSCHKYEANFGFVMQTLYDSFQKDPLKTYSIDNIAIEAQNSDNNELVAAFIDSVPADTDISESQADKIIKSWIWEISTKYILPKLPPDQGNKYLDKVKSSLMYAGESTSVLDMIDDWDLVEDIIHKANSKKDFTTGIPALDNTIEGGLGRQELGLLQANTNVGKTWYILNIALMNAMRGKNVMIVELELGWEEMIFRLAVLLLRKPSVFLKGDKENTLKDLKKQVETKLKGRLRLVKDYPRKFTIYDLEKHVKQTQLQAGYMPDLIVIDYADLFALPPKQARWEAIGDIYTQLKSFSSEFNVGIWTAGQLTRGAATKERTDISDTAGSYDKARIADVIINLEETGEGGIKARVEKTRTAGKYESVNLIPDFSVGDLIGINVSQYFNKNGG
jgi:KaiC/GvpD/RAD55 family RecA-like ATPase